MSVNSRLGTNTALKQAILSVPAVSRAWETWQRRRFLREYRQRREHYDSQVRRLGLHYSAAASATAARARVADRGHDVATRSTAALHTAAFLPRLGWHSILIEELSKLGHLSLFDYTEAGITWMELYRGNRSMRDSMNRAFLQWAIEVHRQRPVDWIYVYASGTEIAAETIEAVQAAVGAPVVGMCLDDKNSWTAPSRDGYRPGQIDLAPVLDLAWTSSRVACDWYLAEGGRPAYLPEGCSPDRFKPVSATRDIDVSFVGQAYGFRPRFLRELRRAGINIQGFGRGWPSGPISDADYVAVLNRSRINLGLGGIGYAPEITNVKARDFEIPCAGGGLYVTTYNADLALHFDVGREIACYRDVDEAIELLRYYLKQPEEAAAMSRRARARCIEDHTWIARFGTVLRLLGIVRGPREPIAPR
jgi:hypothetical protein